LNIGEGGWSIAGAEGTSAQESGTGHRFCARWQIEQRSALTGIRVSIASHSRISSAKVEFDAAFTRLAAVTDNRGVRALVVIDHHAAFTTLAAHTIHSQLGADWTVDDSGSSARTARHTIDSAVVAVTVAIDNAVLASVIGAVASDGALSFGAIRTLTVSSIGAFDRDGADWRQSGRLYGAVASDGVFDQRILTRRVPGARGTLFGTMALSTRWVHLLVALTGHSAAIAGAIWTDHRPNDWSATDNTGTSNTSEVRTCALT